MERFLSLDQAIMNFLEVPKAEPLVPYEAAWDSPALRASE
jgi:hypothetical protein